MNKHYHKSIFILLINLFIVAPFVSQSSPTYQDDIPVLGEGYYLVVGAFNLPSNAVRYSNLINSKGENSKVGVNPNKSIHYVYVIYSMDLEFIKSKWIEYRETTEFANAWVFKNVKPSVSNDGFIDIESQSGAVSNIQEQEIFEDPSEKPENQAPKIEIPIVEEEPLEGEGYPFIFNVVSATTLKEVPGYVSVVDAVRNKVMTSLETNKPQLVPDPGTAEKNVLLICDIFGYVKQQTTLDLEDPTASGEPNVSQDGKGNTIVNFELVRHKAGDIITMYHVYFYNDAAIMKPESKFELNSLLDMLQENENLKIRIHGHTNGNAPGKLIKLREDDNNLFEVTPNNIQGTGSAKQLSLERAAIIAKYLINKGIDGKRMEMKGWGGKKMLYDKKSESASRNVRVEVEILKD